MHSLANVWRQPMFIKDVMLCLDEWLAKDWANNFDSLKETFEIVVHHQAFYVAVRQLKDKCLIHQL